MSSPGCGLTNMVTVGRPLSCDAVTAHGSCGTLSDVSSSNTSTLQHRDIVRLFMHKLAQVVVQSRYGNKPNLQDRVPDWEIVPNQPELQHVQGLSDGKFNLDLLDNVEIREQFDRLLGDWTLTPGNAFTVQILIQTADGDLFVLEMWSLVMKECASSAPSRHNDTKQLYRKLSSLLKSVLVASRITPGFRQSFYQSATSYVMFYTITTSPPILKHLGKQYAEHLFPAVSCSDGQYRLEVRYRTSYERDVDFNCSILHREMYYSSLASLNSAASGGGSAPGQSPHHHHPPHFSSDKYLDRATDPTASTMLDRHFFAATSMLQQRHQQNHRQQSQQQLQPLQNKIGLPSDYKLGARHPWQQGGPDTGRGLTQQQQEALARRVSIDSSRPRKQQYAEGSSPTLPIGVVCSSLPSRMTTPHTALGTSPTSTARSPPSPSRVTPPNLPKSPPTAIPKPETNGYCPFDGAASAPHADMYMIPRVSLPPGDLFASIVHGPSATDATLTTSYSASDEDDSDDDTTPPADLAGTSAGGGSSGPGRSVGSAGEPRSLSKDDPEYVMVDTPPAFMDNRSPNCELGVFYYACRNAPPLFTSNTDISSGGSGSSTAMSQQHQPWNSNTSAASSRPVVSGERGGVVLQQGHVDQDELFSQGKPNSFGADVLLQDNSHDLSKHLTPYELRFKRFEDNLGRFNNLVESLHSSSELEPA